MASVVAAHSSREMPACSLLRLLATFALLSLILLLFALLYHPTTPLHSIKTSTKPQQTAARYEPSEADQLLTSIPEHVPNDKRKVIYFGSRFFGQQFEFNDLPKACRVSNKPKDLHKADAVIFHALDPSMDLKVSSLQERAMQKIPYDQVWVVVMYEAPIIYGSLRGAFNWTMTYRRDSDIYSPYCGRIRPAPLEKSIAHMEPKLEKFRLGGTRKKQVVWMVSNCFANNDRLSYATELSKYIPTDIYGACSPNGLRCARKKEQSCWDMVASEYKFYLSFESSHCKDYITEKFYRALYYGVLPVVYGGAGTEDYLKLAPHHSYIDTRDFDSPQHLAEFLLKLDSSPKLYDEYFAWRKNYTLQINASFVGQDVLCAKLWNLDKYRKSYSEDEFQRWWQQGAECVEPPYRPPVSTIHYVLLPLTVIFSLSCSAYFVRTLLMSSAFRNRYGHIKLSL